MNQKISDQKLEDSLKRLGQVLPTPSRQAMLQSLTESKAGQRAKLRLGWFSPVIALGGLAAVLLGVIVLDRALLNPLQRQFNPISSSKLAVVSPIMEVDNLIASLTSSANTESDTLNRDAGLETNYVSADSAASLADQQSTGDFSF